MSVQFDSVELLTTEYMPENVKHEDSPEREVSVLPLAREDGSILISERFGMKTIVLNGILSEDSQNNLETKIDYMKQLFSKVNGNLDIDFIGATRRYVATCVKSYFDREHFHLKFVPWRAEFLVPSGEGKDTSPTTALSAEVKTSFPSTSSFSMLGSKAAKPTITINLYNVSSSPSPLKGIAFENLDTGEKMIIAGSFSIADGTLVVINCETKTVTVGGVAADFYGVFPNFRVGTNNFKIYEGSIVNQQSSTVTPGDFGSAYLINATTARLAQSFQVPYTNASFKGAKFIIAKTGTPGNITVRIETDNGNKPSGTLVDANATGTISSGSVTGSAVLLAVTFSGTFTLEANTKYWIVISAASVDGSNYYEFSYASTGIYENGNSSRSTDSGSTYTDEPGNDIGFQILFGGVADTLEMRTTIAYTKTYL